MITVKIKLEPDGRLMAYASEPAPLGPMQFIVKWPKDVLKEAGIVRDGFQRWALCDYMIDNWLNGSGITRENGEAVIAISQGPTKPYAQADPSGLHLCTLKFDVIGAGEQKVDVLSRTVQYWHPSTPDNKKDYEVGRIYTADQIGVRYISEFKGSVLSSVIQSMDSFIDAADALRIRVEENEETKALLDLYDREREALDV